MGGDWLAPLDRACAHVLSSRFKWDIPLCDVWRPPSLIYLRHLPGLSGYLGLLILIWCIISQLTHWEIKHLRPGWCVMRSKNVLRVLDLAPAQGPGGYPCWCPFSLHSVQPNPAFSRVHRHLFATCLLCCVQFLVGLIALPFWRDEAMGF